MRSRFSLLSIAALTLVACGPSPSTPDASSNAQGTYANVATIFTTSCNFSSCHGGAGAGAAMLNLQRSITAGTLHTDLIGRASCEYDAMPLVDPGNPMNSWLYLKVAGPHSGADLTFTPDTSWDHGGLTPDAMGRYPASTCPLTSAGAITFGQVMPMGGSGGLPAAQADVVRAWIANGAPGPM